MFRTRLTGPHAKFMLISLVTMCWIINIFYASKHFDTLRDLSLSKSRQRLNIAALEGNRISKEASQLDEVGEGNARNNSSSLGSRHVFHDKFLKSSFPANISSLKRQSIKALILENWQNITSKNVAEVNEIIPQEMSEELKKEPKKLFRTKNDGLSDVKFKLLQVRIPSKHSTKPLSLSSYADREEKRMTAAASVKGHLEMKRVFQKWKKFTGRKTNITSDRQRRRNLPNSSRGYLSDNKDKTLKKATLKPSYALLHPAESHNIQFSPSRSISVFNNQSPLNTGLRKNEGGVELRSIRTEPCQPVHRIVFLKTHKAASTTTASIFERYGFYRNLTFAVGKNHVLSFSEKFSHKHILHFPGMRGKSYDMLVNHARYNREEMELVVQKATFITILRKPEDQLDSAFGYFEMYRGMKLLFKKNPLEAFMEDPMMYYQNYTYAMRLISRNGQLFDLGLEHEFDGKETQIKRYIRKLDKDFDLVLITEYYDESLILLKKLMCWSFEDILYISNGIRSSSHRFQKSQELVKKIRQWNYGDLLLYEHFNKTLWRKIVEYGPTFQKDLTYFRNLRQAVLQECIDMTKVSDFDRREEKFVLKNKSDKCVSLLRDDVGYTHLIKKSMFERYT